jgi:hypothetical protein
MADATDEACRFALLAVPALLTALECEVSPDIAGDIVSCRELLEVAERFAERIGKTDDGRYTRAGEIAAARRRLDAYLDTGGTARAEP